MGSKTRDVAVAVVLFGALLVLAVLQYRWIGQVSEADRERLREDLRAAVDRFSDNFNGEIERLVQLVNRGGADVEPLWRDVAAHPGVLRRLWAADDPDLPGSLRALAERLPKDFNGFRPGRGGRSPMQVDGSIPAVAVPRFTLGESDLQWMIAELDRDYIEETWIPELIARDFGNSFDVRVGQRLERGPEDEAAPLFALRVGGFGRGKGDKGPPGFPGKQGKRPLFNDGGGPVDAPWMVVASYRSGTMSELVDRLRLRNLAVSFGILLLMGVSVAMLILSSRRANELAKQQMEFVAGVTHELRTPLAVIQSASQNLADGVAKGEGQARRYGGVILDQSRRLGNMVEQVLRFAGLSSQHGELLRSPVEVQSLIEEAIADCQPELHAAGTEVAQEVSDGLPPIDGDKAALRHCLRNLLENAAKHGEGAPVRLIARERDGMVEIAVEDSGPGIEAADLPHIFEPFFRGKRAKEDQVKGSGLGLSLVKKIVEAHGGRVDAGNHPGGGACLRVLLPVAKAE